MPLTVPQLANEICDDLHEQLQFYDALGRKANGLILADVLPVIRATLERLHEEGKLPVSEKRA
jgi:hypothetical protein